MLTHDSRSAISRARFFLERAADASANQRVEFEAFLEAAIVFGRAAVHRFKTSHEKHSAWKAWWDSLLNDPTMVFFRDERNWILKQGPAKIGQKIMMPSIGSGGRHIAAAEVASASMLYYFDDPAVPATTTVERHLTELERLLKNGETRLV
jgi:hypothetical protein